MFNDEARAQLERSHGVQVRETDAQKERRLEREAQECIGSLVHSDIPAKTGQGARVDVTYQRDENDIEHAGHFKVLVPIDLDPWEASRELAEVELERRFPNAAYTSVDDIRSR